MRHLSNYENTIVKEIVSLTEKGETCNFQEIYNSKNSNELKIEILRKPQTNNDIYEIKIMIKNVTIFQKEKMTILFNKMYNELISIINIIDYLEKNG